MKSFIIENGFFKLGDIEETTHARLKRLLLTPIDNTYGFLDYGSRVLDYFHMKSSTENIQNILSEVKMLIGVYEKDSIKLQSIYATVSTPDDSAADLLEINMEYDLGGNRTKTVVIATKNSGEN